MPDLSRAARLGHAHGSSRADAGGPLPRRHARQLRARRRARRRPGRAVTPLTSLLDDARQRRRPRPSAGATSRSRPACSSAAAAAAGIRSTAAFPSSSPITCATPTRERPIFDSGARRRASSAADTLSPRSRRRATRRAIPARTTSRPRSASRARLTTRFSSVPATARRSTPGTRTFTIYLISLFGAVAPLLNVKRGQTIVDSGCGYAWSTEWLFRSGFDAIGVDICRTYLEIAVARIGVVPAAPGRRRRREPSARAGARRRDPRLRELPPHPRPPPGAWPSYDRVLKDGGTVILAEPGAAHEDAKVSVDAMEKYGILERGMELDDVRGYAAGHGVRRARAAVSAASRPS